jgi:hypothetical protein
LQVDALAAKYGEARLLAMVRKKYLVSAGDGVAPPAAAAASVVAATFTEPGTLGLAFSPNDGVGDGVRLIRVNPGTQAEQFTELSDLLLDFQDGLVLLAVNGRSVAGQGYTEALDVIKAAGRPLTLEFARPGAAAAPPASQVSPMSRRLAEAARKKAEQAEADLAAFADEEAFARLEAEAEVAEQAAARAAAEQEAAVEAAAAEADESTEDSGDEGRQGTTTDDDEELIASFMSAQAANEAAGGLAEAPAVVDLRTRAVDLAEAPPVAETPEEAPARAATVRVDGGAVIVTFHDAGPLGISFGSQVCCVCDRLPSLSTVYLAMCRSPRTTRRSSKGSRRAAWPRR